jgi:3-phenylpropionate/cinnamic acid dioxygenase small subunit
MIIDWLQIALHSFNLDTPNWYGWRTHDDNGNKIPNEERMCWEHTIVIKDGAIKPSKQELENRIEQLKTEHEDKIAQQESKKESAIAKLKALGLDEEEVKAILGV